MGKHSFIRAAGGVVDQAACAWGLTDETHGLAEFASGDVGWGVCMTNGWWC